MWKNIWKGMIWLFYLRLEGDRIDSSCMACIFHTAPAPELSDRSLRRAAECLYSAGVPRRGHAEKLVRMLIKEAGRLGVGSSCSTPRRWGVPV